MHNDRERCLRAVQSKDARFDGWFFTAVTSTGIYCRPSCPVRPPKASSMRFYPSAAAAQQGGFRACKRCRPDASPGSPQWNERADVVARAMRLIADGVVDRDGVGGLAGRLGYSTRQIERHLQAELGAGPLAIARAQRAQTARMLIETTTLPIADTALAAGFASVRSFNATVREVFAASPTELRQRAARGGQPATPGTLSLRLEMYLRRGWPIASGAVEGACKCLVRDRFERSGMRWTQEMAEAMLKLRAVYLSGDWDSHWKWHVEQDQLRLYRKGSWQLVRK